MTDSSVPPARESAESRAQSSVWEAKPGARLSKNRFSGRRPPNMLNRNRSLAAIVVALTLILPLGLFYFLAGSDKKGASKSDKITDTAASFQALLSDGTSTQLVNEYNRLESSPESELPIVIDNLKNRIAIAERLHELSDDQAAVEFGTLGKIRSLAQLHQVTVANDIEDQASTQLLIQLANDNLNHSNDQIDKNALLALAVNSVVQYSRNPQSVDFSETLNRFRACAAKSVEDLEIAGILFRSVTWLDKKNLQEQAAELYRELSDSLASSTRPEIQMLAETARNHFLTIQFKIDEIADEIENYAPPQAIVDKIGLVIESPNIDSGGLKRLIPLIDMMVARSQIAEAKHLADQLRNRGRPDNSDDQSLQLAIEQLQIRVAAFGKAFDFGSLQTIGGQLNLNHRQKPALVLFWKPEDPESMENLNRLNQRMASYLDRQGLDIIAVCVPEENDNETRDQLDQLSREMPTINFVCAPKQSAEGQALDQSLPIPQHPFVIVLGRSNEVLLLDPPAYDFKSKLDKIVSDDKKN